MLGYHVFIAWKSLRRTPGNSLLIVAGIALGVAVATLFSAIRHTYARDPVPEKSSVLHYVRMDSWDPQKAYPDGIPPQITYRDMIGIMKSDIPIRQTASFMAAFRAEQGRVGMFQGRFCHRDFFAMFNVPFRYGSAWDKKADEGAEPVVVLSEELNNQWFGGEDSVGRLVRMEDRDFRVVGVLARWSPWIKFYDLTREPTSRHESLYVPMSVAWSLKMRTISAYQSWKPRDPGIEGWLTGEDTFLQMWVELPGPKEVLAYRAFLDAHVMEQKRIGRFQRPLDNRVTPLLDYMEERGCTPPEATAMMIAGDLFLAACALSLMGLLLARFLARAAEIGVRRALGATHWDILVQHVVECEVVGLAGGLLGLALAAGCLRLVSLWFKTFDVARRDDVFRMDLTMAGFAVGASLVAACLAGAYPAYRVCRITPASHLKIQ